MHNEINLYNDIYNKEIVGEVITIKESTNSLDYISTIPQWEPNKFFNKEFKQWGCFSSIISGSSRSGKSYLLKHLLLHNNNELLNRFDFVVVFTPTLDNGFYKSFLKSKLIFEDFNPNVINSLKKKYREYESKGKKMKWLVILDDCADSKSKYITDIERLYFSGRHSGASVIFLTQKCSLTSTSWMANTTLFISLFAGSRREKDYLSKNVIGDCIDGDFPDKKIVEIERIGSLIHTMICQKFNALIILPYESNRKLLQYKA